MGRVTFRTGRAGEMASLTDYSRKFPADRPGTCFLCEREYLRGDMMKWDQKTLKPDEGRRRKQWLPVHVDCNDWKYKARNNPRTRDGGYDVAPSTPTRDDRRETMRANRAIDREAGLTIPPMPGHKVIVSSSPRPPSQRQRKQSAVARRLVEIERFRQSH